MKHITKTDYERMTSDTNWGQIASVLTKKEVDEGVFIPFKEWGYKSEPSTFLSTTLHKNTKTRFISRRVPDKGWAILRSK